MACMRIKARSKSEFLAFPVVGANSGFGKLGLRPVVGRFGAFGVNLLRAFGNFREDDHAVRQTSAYPLITVT